MIKEFVKKINKKIRGSYLAKLLDAKEHLKDYEKKKEEWENEKKSLIDKNRVLNLEVGKYKKQYIKVSEIQQDLKDACEVTELIKKDKKELENKIQELESELFESNLEVGKYKTQCEEYEKQLENYRTEGRYIVKKIRPGKTPNTIKTKISRPMAESVVRYMKDEHQ